MARARVWENLSPAYRRRLEKAGITKRRYELGANLQHARGHTHTPEHGIAQARKHPAKYRKYLQKKEKIIGGGPFKTPEDEARELNDRLDEAYANFYDRLHEYHKYRDGTVRANVYGGETPESGEVPGMSRGEAIWTARADTEEIRSRARDQYIGNPWWYH
jgi:hypothetical protein